MRGFLHLAGHRRRLRSKARLAAGVAAAVLGAAALMTAPTAAEAASCPPARAQPRVSLEALPGTVVYDHSHGRRSLRRMQGQSGVSGLHGEWHPIGLTRTELQFRTKISVQTMPTRGRRHCATLSAVDAQLGYDTITILVDSRYRKGSCPYVNVLKHENLHLAIFRDTLAVYAPKVERRLIAAANALAPVSARTPDEGAQKLQKALQREMDSMFKEMNAKLDADNERIDTAASYKRQQAKCSNW